MTNVRTHGVVSGRVQGVNFRYSMQREARRLQVGGWVRNRPDGTVEFEAEGPQDALDDLIAWAHEGPGYARVDTVRTHAVSPQGDRRFDVLD